VRGWALVPSAVAVRKTTASAWYAYATWRDLNNDVAGLTERAKLRRLSTLTIQNFPARDLESPDLFWKSIQREGNPMRDSWGVEYRLSISGDAASREYTWASAGPDQRFGTADDILVKVPYPTGAGQVPDFLPGEGSNSAPLSNDAK
jgi:hypothetical protein